MTHYTGNPQRKVTQLGEFGVYYDPTHEEYEVRSKRQHRGEGYFTSDQEDAIDTAKAMIRERGGTIPNPRGGSFTIGDTVKYSAEFLRSTGMYTGEIPRARGTITNLESFGGSTLATIDWGNPEIPAQVITANLERVQSGGVPRRRNPGNYEAGVPNLDAMEPGELWHFHSRHQRGQNAKQLFPQGGIGTRIATANLANYAANKATAMMVRIDGDIPTAQMYENIADTIYQSLPDWARW